MKIRRSSIYERWVEKLRDSKAKSKIYTRIDRLAHGNMGDIKPIGEGCSELRIDYGPGYRVYLKKAQDEIIILLCGGDKSTQEEDIKKAKKIAENY